MSDTYRMNAEEHDAMHKALDDSVTIRKRLTPTTDRDELVERLLAAPNIEHARIVAPDKRVPECVLPIADRDAAAARIQADAATIARMREALRNWDVQATAWLESRVPNAKPDWMLPAIKTGRAALKGGDHG